LLHIEGSPCLTFVEEESEELPEYLCSSLCPAAEGELKKRRGEGGLGALAGHFRNWKGIEKDNMGSKSFSGLCKNEYFQGFV
jgi:hypothetical protein